MTHASATKVEIDQLQKVADRAGERVSNALDRIEKALTKPEDCDKDEARDRRERSMPPKPNGRHD